MTLAALSPLYTWWLLFFALLAVVYKVVSPAVVRRQERPWPPPVVLTINAPRLADHVLIGRQINKALAAVRSDPWAAPDPKDQAHTYIWTPGPEFDYVTWQFSRPPHPWTRVG